MEKYWYDLWQLCVTTPLGRTPVGDIGQEITLERMDKKPAMVESLTARTCEEAEKHDTGVIPGDHKGVRNEFLIM